jgi:hypothetical protein
MGDVSCSAAGNACCPGGALGGPGTTAVAPYCLDALKCCATTNTCAITCDDAGLDAAGQEDANAAVVCGSVDDAGQPRSGTCPTGEFCCDTGHTGAPGFGCQQLDASCIPKP